MTETRFPNGISGGKNTDLDIQSDSDIALYPTNHIWIKQQAKLIFEGTTPDDWEAKLQATAVTADRDIILPDASGTIALLETISVGTEGTASGDGSIAYNNTTGVFTYTPPDLSTYLTAVPSSISVSTASISSTLSLTLLSTAPASPVNGMIAASDGTGWNPASDGLQHINAYINGAWVQIA